MGFFDAVLRQGGWTAMVAGFALAAVPAALGLVAFWRRAARLREAQSLNAGTATRNAAIVEASGEGIFELDAAGAVRYANPAAARLSGYAVEELLGIDYRELVSVAEHASDRKLRLTTDMRRGVGAMLRRKDGRLRPIEYRVVALTSENAAGARVAASLFTFADISERARLDAMLQEMQTTARVGGYEYWPLDWKKIMSYYDVADRPVLEKAWREAIESGAGFSGEARLTTPQGRSLWVQIIANAERHKDRTLRVHGIFQDITERRAAERQLRETRDFFAQTLDALPLMVTYVNADGAVTYCNRPTAQWWNLTREDIVGRRLADLLGDEEYARLAPRIEAVLQAKPQSFMHYMNVSGVHGEWQIHLVPELSDAGRVRGFIALMHDLSEIKRLEARLAQAQKMEAVGQLTGGIAHDFNNLLGVVVGNLQLLERSLGEQPNQARKVATAMRAAMRGADLTRRLLAFARRQILDPVVVDLNQHLKGWDDLLHRTLGDSIDVRVTRAIELWPTRVDPGQIESAILNLAINARDAMPQGGKLTIETSNQCLDAAFCVEHPELHPGDYVCIAVSDTGVGIAPETLGHVFEPFFTTKEPCKGSGLGLSMVHGFAKQSGGAATIDSTVGIGTTVRIFLPRSAEAPPRHDDTGIQKILPGGGETILLVEDDLDLRETSAAALQQLGYRVLQASDAQQALKLLTERKEIALLFTDIMIPGGMLGPALAHRARELRPNINVLFTTGYAHGNVLANGVGVSYAEVLHKPFRAEELAMRIRHLLDREVRVA
jgi:PAS domain S-box-containing protein